MKIVFVNWDCFCAEDVCVALHSLGHEVYVTQLSDKAKGTEDEVFIESLKKIIKENHSELVFSMNYYGSISIACEEMHCPYISWIYDNPQLYVYDKTVINEYNYVFSFDSHMVSLLRSRGVEQIYYIPLAANVKRLTADKLTDELYGKYNCEVAFVGSLYNEKGDYYSRLLAKAKEPYLQGYLEGILAAQKHVYGYNFMAECLTPDIVSVIRKYMPYTPGDKDFVKEEEVYADIYLSKKLATINRVELLYMLGNFFDVHFYTFQQTPITNVKHCGTIRYFEEMPVLFRIAKINLNASMRSIKNGIPLRAMDILGCGGFLLSNFQEDFLRHFDEGVHFVSYSSLEEAVDKCRFYLTHEEERKKIMENALTIMKREHTFEVRIPQMLDIVKRRYGK